MLLLSVAYKNHSLVANGGSEFGPTNGALLGCLLIALRAILTQAHVPAGRKDHIGWIWEADGALLTRITFEEVICSVDIL